MSARALPHQRPERDARVRPPRARARLLQWAITLAATAASTYALDAVATVSGILLAASQLLQGLDHALLLVLLAGTYALWFAGLRST